MVDYKDIEVTITNLHTETERSYRKLQHNIIPNATVEGWMDDIATDYITVCHHNRWVDSYFTEYYLIVISQLMPHCTIEYIRCINTSTRTIGSISKYLTYKTKIRRKNTL